MHGTDGAAHLPVRKGEQPSDATISRLPHMQAQRLHQHHLRNMFDDQETAGLRFAQFVHHAVERPAQACPVRICTKMHDRRENAQQHLRMKAIEREVPADDHAFSAAVERNHDTRWPIGKHGTIIDTGQRQVAG